jgi:hypothetical protein
MDRLREVVSQANLVSRDFIQGFMVRDRLNEPSPPTQHLPRPLRYTRFDLSSRRLTFLEKNHARPGEWGIWDR